jgi:Fic family protein
MPNHELLLKPLQQREALRSSSLEGTYATPEQLLLFQMEPKEPRSNYDPANAWMEVSNYSSALQLGQQLLDSMPVSLRLIKELHKELLKGVRGRHRDPGNFRRSQVHIGSDRRFIPPPHQEAVRCLNELEIYIHDPNLSIDPLIFCFMVHYQFEAIHPFLDGNGRVGRLLLSLMIYQWCSLKKPWLYLSSFFDRYKDEYIRFLFQVSSNGQWGEWIKYCLRATIYEAKDAIRRFDKLVALRQEYVQFISTCGGNVRLNGLIEQLFVTPVITVPRAASFLNISYPTARSDIGILMKLGILVESGTETRPKVFLAPKIMDIAYGDSMDD